MLGMVRASNSTLSFPTTSALIIASVVCFLQYAGLSKLISVVIPRFLYGLVETVSELNDVIPKIVLGS